MSVIEDLQRQLARGESWENDTLMRYLDGLAALLGSIETTYLNVGERVPDDSWAMIAKALNGARHYE